VLYIASTASEGGEKYLAEAFRRFCRSIELCDDYLRGYYGLKLVHVFLRKEPSRRFSDIFQTTNRLLTIPQPASRKSDTGLPFPDIKTVQLLNEVATAKLSEIVRKSVGGEAAGYDQGEVIAAKELLNRETASVTR